MAVLFYVRNDIILVIILTICQANAIIWSSGGDNNIKNNLISSAMERTDSRLSYYL